MVKKELTEKNLESASGGVVVDPGLFQKYKVYNNKTGKHVKSFWSKDEALKYDKEYNGGVGELLDEDSAAFDRYKDSWEEYNSTKKRST